MIRKYAVILQVMLLFFATSCSNYQKVLKSTDYEYKYKKAKEYYETHEYAKAITLYQELVNVYRGTSRSDETYYYYAKSFFGQRDYFMAGYYFRNLVSEYPRSEYAEESQFMMGNCFYLDSPKARLDQDNTLKGIESLQLYINLYPDTERSKEAQHMIDEMTEKLVYKSYLSGRLYYDMEDDRAATISLGNSLKDYPDTKNREELMYMLFKAKYYLGERSIEEKKRVRLNDALDEYYTFIDEWGESKYRKEVDRYFSELKRMLNLKDEDLNID